MGSSGVGIYEQAVIMCQTKNVMNIQTGVMNDNHVVYTLPSLHCTPENRQPTINNSQEVTNHYLRALDPILYAARGESFGNVHRFEKLHTLTVDMQGLRVEQVSPVFRLPSLRVLVLKVVRHYSYESEKGLLTWDCPDGASNVHTLEFWTTSAGPHTVRSAIRSCRALRSFVYSQHENAPTEGYFDVLLELTRHQDSLRELKLYHWSSSYFEAPSPEFLGGFTQLQHLDIPLGALCSSYYSSFDREDAQLEFSHRLPSSLVYLHLDVYRPMPPPLETTQAFERMCHQLSSLPNLKSVDLWVELDVDLEVDDAGTTYGLHLSSSYIHGTRYSL